MWAYKTAKQQIAADSSLLSLMKTFQLMMNDCIRLGFESADVSYGTIKSLCYPRMMEYEVENSYRISAMFETSNLLKKYRTEAKWRHPGKPYCRNLFVSAAVGVHVEGNCVIMPGGVSLEFNPYTRSIVMSPGVELVSATVVPNSLSLVYRKDVPRLKARGAVALDINLENVTTYDTEGRSKVYPLSKVVKVGETYRRVTSRFRRHDFRVKRSLFRKYAELRRNRKGPILHEVSSLIVDSARKEGQGIVMENLRGMRKLFTKSSGSSANYLSRMTTWPYAELQRQVEYKGNWAGINVVKIDPVSTSNDCSECSGGMQEDPRYHPMVKCTKCGLVIDRDLNAGKNILKRALRSGAVGSVVEAM